MKYYLGIVGHGKDKFTPRTESEAKNLISKIIKQAIDVYGKENVILVSGHSPANGIDMWSEKEATDLGISMDIKIPKQLTWDGEYGYRARNVDIANQSDSLHNIVVSEYPQIYAGRKFDFCYHCNSKDHVKSGGCWTMKHAIKLGKPSYIHIIK